jgi:hypothetical protein
MDVDTFMYVFFNILVYGSKAHQLDIIYVVVFVVLVSLFSIFDFQSQSHLLTIQRNRMPSPWIYVHMFSEI